MRGASTLTSTVIFSHTIVPFFNTIILIAAFIVDRINL